MKCTRRFDVISFAAKSRVSWAVTLPHPVPEPLHKSTQIAGTDDRETDRRDGRGTYASVTTMKSSQFQASLRYVNWVRMKPRASTFTNPSHV